ncbi:hypothetical protein ACFVRD_35855 [Streptomyces sp. NPDC057908]|uniref:hypothetical protein n=1 Tax=Streptomyces sp. NPDC057908 TaxID=3346276 RepID=UPI0036F0F911
MGLQQELWALLVVYQSLRRAMVDAIESRPGTCPDRASFTIALHMAAEQVIIARGVLEPADDHGGIATAVLAALLPPRRARTSARLVKCPASQYTVVSQDLPRKSQRITSVRVALHRRDEVEPDDLGFRERTLRLLRTDPGRAWRTIEISQALGITVTTKYRSLCTQINQWAEQTMLIGEGRGRCPRMAGPCQVKTLNLT